MGGNSGQLLHDLLQDASQRFTSYLLALVALSGLTMALIQAVKDLTSVRAVYNRRKLLQWMNTRASACTPAEVADGADTYGFQAGGKLTEGLGGECVSVAQAEDQLVELATDRDRYAFYSAELEKLSTQFVGAAQLVLDYPSNYTALFKLLACYSSQEDVAILLKESMPPAMPMSLERDHNPEDVRKLAAQRQKIIDARTRVHHQITQSIASFQMSAGARWQFWLRIASLVVSILLVFGLLWFWSALREANTAGIIMTSVVAGLLAPVARDILAALQNLRD